MTKLTKLFAQKWTPLHDKKRKLVPLSDSELRYPGVYLLAYTSEAICGRRVRPRDVFYVGMTVSAGGLKQRLKQFQSSIEGGNGHGPAFRFYKKCARRIKFSKLSTKPRFFFAAYSIRCISKKNEASPSDWRQMGKVLLLEFQAIAHVLDRTGHLPKLNNLAKDALAELAG